MLRSLRSVVDSYAVGGLGAKSGGGGGGREKLYRMLYVLDYSCCFRVVRLGERFDIRIFTVLAT